MAWLDKIHHPEKYLGWFLKWTALGIAMGAIGGCLGAAFHHALHFVTHLRLENTWLVLLLPIGGLLSVGVYWIFGMMKNRGTNQLIDAVLTPDRRYNGTDLMILDARFRTGLGVPHHCVGIMVDPQDPVQDIIPIGPLIEDHVSVFDPRT